MSKEVLAKQPGTWTALKNLRIDPNLDPSLFSWTQPRTAKTLQLPAGVQLPLK
jgi:outer membrane lipoprotein-sorting protein